MLAAQTYSATIYIAGELQTIRHHCRAFVMSGACVSIVQVDYVFTGGMETGAAITFINYPRFANERSRETIRERAMMLAEQLLNVTCQRSCTVVFPEESIYMESNEIKAGR